MLPLVATAFLAGATTTSLLITGCTSEARLKQPHLSSISPSGSHESAKVPRNPNDVTALYEREFPDQAPLIRSGKDFTVTEPGYYTPLPPTVLLGARNLREREDISEIIIRHLATKPCAVQPDIKYRFIGFQGNGVSYHDPDKELLQRIRDLKLPLKPISEARESRIVDGVRVDSEQAERGMQYFIVYIRIEYEDRAEVGVNEMPGFSGAGERFTYSLIRSNGQWTITKEEPGPIF